MIANEIACKLGNRAEFASEVEVISKVVQESFAPVRAELLSIRTGHQYLINVGVGGYPLGTCNSNPGRDFATRVLVVAIISRRSPGRVHKSSSRNTRASQKLRG